MTAFPLAGEASDWTGADDDSDHEARRFRYDSDAGVDPVKQLTVRGFDENLERRLREVAKARGVSLNQAALILLREGAGLEAPRRRTNVVGDSLDVLIGSWSKAEEAEFLRTIRDFEEVDPSLWQ
jgi:hypothetical protein